MFWLVVVREENNLRVGRYFPYLVRGGDATDLRHVNIEKDKRRLQFFHFLNGIFAIDRFAADIDTPRR